MAVTAYQRYKFFWGAVDVTFGSDPYTPAQKSSLGTSAVAASGIGVRRAQLIFTRTAPGALAEDVAVMHFDFLNITGGAPDDTWTTADFSLVNTMLVGWWNNTKPFVSSRCIWKEVRYYRVGTGVVAPNPPANIAVVGLPGTASTTMLPPQCACSISLHVAPRKSWGRTYLPGPTVSAIDAPGVFSHAYVDAISGAADSLVTTAASNDFELVVLSKHLEAALKVEQIAVDDVVDIQRRRRYEHPTYRKALP